MRTRVIGPFVLILAILSLCEPASAVILYAKRLRNTAPPTGSLAQAGWQWEGGFGNFLGTAIGKKDFITAGHIGGNVGDYFNLNGVNYKTTAMYDDPLSDLRIWHVKQTLPTHASLYTSNKEVGKTAMIIGRGTGGGQEIRVNGELKGWRWRDYDFFESWGQNVISGLKPGQSDIGNDVANQHIAWTFDRNGIANEGIISDGDSGGGVFIKDGTTWKLAGVNHDVDNTFSYPTSPFDQFTAALFDMGGMLDANQNLIANTGADIPATSIATRISSRTSWINSVISGGVSPTSVASVRAVSAQGVPEPGICGVLLSVGVTWSLFDRAHSRLKRPRR